MNKLIEQSICALGVFASVNIFADALIQSAWWTAFAMALNVGFFTVSAFLAETRR